MIESSRLKIRDFLKEDLDIVHQLVAEPDIYKYQHWGPNTLDDTTDFINMCITAQFDKPRLTYEMCILDLKTNEFIGAIGMRIKSQLSKKADLGYWIRKDRWGNGLGTEATKAMIKFGFEKLHMNKIYATAAPENKGSSRVLEKSGMKKEGLLKDDLFIRGEFRDSVLMAILKSEYTN